MNEKEVVKSVSEFENFPTIEDLAINGQKVKTTENQLKVMANKYLKGDTVELWLRRVSRNIAFAELLNTNEIPADLLVEGINHKMMSADADSRTRVILLQNQFMSNDEKWKNFFKFQERMHHLTATNPIATKIVRSKEEQYYKMMANFDFLPNSPCLMNAGRDLQQLHACFRGDQPIMTADGIKEISDIKKGELVLTASGKFRKVIRKMERFADAYRIIDVWKMPNKTLVVTDDHPILCLNKVTNKEEWKSASKITSEDYVAISYPKEIKDKEEISMLEFINNKKEHIVKNGFIYKINKDKRSREYSQKTKPIKEKISIDYDLMKIFGYYLSEGDIDKDNAVRFTFNSNEIEYMQDLINLFERKFGISSKIKKSNFGNWSNVRFFSRTLVKMFKDILGEGFNKKKIPFWILQLPIEKQKGLLTGIIRGDGYPAKNKKNTNIRTVLHNKDLVYGIWVILARMGLLANFKKDKISSLASTNPYRCNLNSYNSEKIFDEIFINKEFNGTTQLSMRRVKERYINGTFFLPIKNITVVYEPIKVYNFEVEEEHTYVANNIAVHNCYVIPVPDSMEGIFKAVTAQGLIHQSGGGTGFSFSRLRPEGDHVKSTKGIASGPMSFIRIFDVSTDVVKQGGQRRGANMGILHYKHPDIRKFITSKSKDRGFLWNFNISVALDKEFMNAVETDSEFELINPRTGKPAGVERAKELWDLMAKSAWETGDPGFVVIDRINETESNPTPQLGQIESTNPCVTGDTLVSTEYGLMRMGNLVNNYPEGGLNILTDNRVPLEIKNLDGTVIHIKQNQIKGISLDNISRAFTTGVKEVFKIETNCGLELEATSDHKLLTNDGWIAVKDLNLEKDRILIQQDEGFFNKNSELPFIVENNFRGENGKRYNLNLPNNWSRELGQVLGWLIGDGWLRVGDKDCRIGFTFGKSDEAVLDYLKPIINNFYGKEIKDVKRERNTKHLSYHSKYFVEFFNKLGVKPIDAQYKTVPESIFTANKEAVIGFLQGLFTSDGTVNFDKKHSISYIRLTSKSKKLLKDVQLLLLNLGITSNIFDRSRGYRKDLFEYINRHGEVIKYNSDGILFELSITRDSINFIENIGFLCNKNKDKLDKFYNKKFYSTEFSTGIKSIASIGNKKVYDLTEPRTLSFITNGMLSLDCGEQPLLPWEPCTLGSINLSNHIKKLNGKTMVDYEKLEYTTRLAINFLDNVVDMSNYAMHEIEYMSKTNRRIGLGVMGWAEMLIKLDISYDSEEAIVLAEEIMGFINTKALEASEDLAEVKGVFYNFKDSIFDDLGNNFRGKSARPRNCARTTIAPTGTIAITAGLQGSGIEPFFAIAYKRFQAEALDAMRKGEEPDKRYVYYEVVPMFMQLAESHSWFGLDKETLFSKIVENHGSVRGIKEIPPHIQKTFVCSYDLHWKIHIDHQAAFQKYTDNAVSKTINMLKTVTVEDIQEAYLYAYRKGCKGVTVYRDGCKEVQVLSSGTTEKKKKERDLTKGASSDYYEIVTGCGDLHVNIAYDDNGPFKIFTNISPMGTEIASLTGCLGIFLSKAFQKGYDPLNAIRHLNSAKGDKPMGFGPNRVDSIPHAISIALKRHLEKTGKIKTDVDKKLVEFKDEVKFSHCIKCFSPNIQYISGCAEPTCQDCGYSKCS